MGAPLVAPAQVPVELKARELVAEISGSKEGKEGSSSGSSTPAVVLDRTLRVSVSRGSLGSAGSQCLGSGVTCSGRGEQSSEQEVALRFSAVSMGVPHCVIYVDDVAAFPVNAIGPLVERCGVG